MEMKQSSSLKIIMKGNPGKISVLDFVNMVDNIRKSLLRLEKHLTGKISTIYLVKEIKSIDSEISVEIEAIPKK